MNPRHPETKTAGFTLVELVLVIALTGVVAVLASTIVGRQMSGYVDLSRRASLVAKADTALRQMARDLRNAVPYSIRIVGSGIEWVPIKGFGRYRKQGPGDVLDFGAADSQFDVIGNFPSLGASSRLVIGNSNVGVAGFNLYESAADGALLPAGSHVITPTTVSVTDSNPTIQLSDPFLFSQDSIAGRFYVVEGASRYLCNSVSGVINYQEDNVIPLTSPTTAILLDGVSACSFSYTLGADYGLVTLRVQVSEGGESIAMVRIVHVENRP